MAAKLILLPGLDGTGLLFEEFLAELPDDIQSRTVTYPIDDSLSRKELVSYIRSRLPDTAQLVLLGESFSGPFALQVAAEDMRVSGVILVASFVTKPIRFLPKVVSRLVRPFLFRRPPRFLLRKALLSEDAPPKLVTDLERALRSVSPKVLAGRVIQVFEMDAREALLATRVPILHIVGSDDRLVRAHAVEEITSLKPGVIRRTLPAPHLVLQVAAKRAASEVAEFVRNCPVRES